MVFHWRLRESKSPQVSRTVLSISADLNNTVGFLDGLRSSFISKSSSPCTNSFVPIPSAPIKIGNTVTFMFPSFLSSLANSVRFLSVLSSGQQERRSPQFSLFFLAGGGITITRFGGRLAEIRWSVGISKIFVRLIF